MEEDGSVTSDQATKNSSADVFFPAVPGTNSACTQQIVGIRWELRACDPYARSLLCGGAKGCTPLR